MSTVSLRSRKRKSTTPNNYKDTKKADRTSIKSPKNNPISIKTNNLAITTVTYQLQQYMDINITRQKRKINKIVKTGKICKLT